MKILKLTLLGMLFLCSYSSLFAHFEVEVNQEIIDDECHGNISITVHGSAGPFDVYLFRNSTSNVVLEEHLNFESGTIDFEPIIANSTYEQTPVIKVYDALGCEWIYDEIILNCDCELVKIKTYEFDNGTYTQTLPSHLQISKPSTCISSDGSIKIVKGPMVNATYPLTYEWSDPSIVVGDQYHTNISPGTHTLTITDSYGCSDEIDIQFLAENGPDIWHSEVCPTCVGQTSGQITIHAATGGGFNNDGSYSDIELIWDFEIDEESTVEDDNENNPNIGFSTVVNLGPGEYCVTVREHFISAEGENIGSCDNVQCFKVDGLVPDSEIEIHSEATLSTITNSCANQATGSIFMAVSGGIKYNEVDCGRNGFDYKFEWSDGETTYDYYRGPGFKPLAGGTYTVTVEDYCGAIDILEFEIPEYPNIEAEISAIIGCVGEGKLLIENIRGGANLQNLTLQVFNPSNELIFEEEVEQNSTRELVNLTDGNYKVNIMDEQTCEQDFPIFVPNHPDIIIQLEEAIDDACLVNVTTFQPYINFDQEFELGNIKVNVTWSDNANYNNVTTYAWVDVMNITTVVSTSQDLTNINTSNFTNPTVNSITYRLTVETDFGENICTKTKEFTVENDIKISKLPLNADWFEPNMECECNLYVTCGDDINNPLEFPTSNLVKCDVLSNITGNIEDCKEYSCFCDYPASYDDIYPSITAFNNADRLQSYPLNCNPSTCQNPPYCIEENRNDEVTHFCLGNCKVEVFCPDWSDKVNNWTPLSEIVDQNCTLQVSVDPNDNEIVNSINFCGSDVELNFIIDFERLESECNEVNIVATSKLRVDGITHNYNTTPITLNGNRYILDYATDFDDLIPNPEGSFPGTHACSGTLILEFSLNNQAYETIELPYEYDNCSSFGIDESFDTDLCDGIYTIPINFPCVGLFEVAVVAGSQSCGNIDNNLYATQTVNNFENFQVNIQNIIGSNNMITEQTVHFRFNGDDNNVLCHTFGPIDCSSPNANDPDGCETDLAAANNNDYQYIAFSDLIQGATPAVITSPLSFNGADPATVRLKNLTNSGFEMKVHEWDYLNGQHEAEQVSFLYGTPGIYDFGGLKAEIGFIDNVNHQFKTFELNANFDEAPVIITTLVTDNDTKPVARRVRNITASTFQLKLQEEPGNNSSFQHGLEKVAYIAIEKGQGTINGKTVVVGNTGKAVNHNWKTVNTPGYFNSAPLIFTEMQSTYGGDLAVVRYDDLTEGSFKVKVEEEQSGDAEVAHATEDVGYILIASDKLCKCDDVVISLQDSQIYNATCNQANGSIDVQPEGGFPSYSFDWSNGATTASISDLDEGTYNLTVTDANGCTAEGEFIVDGLPGLEMKYISYDHPSCVSDNGWAQTYPLGGEEPYTYLWSNGETTQMIENLGPGTYTVTVTDANNCTGQAEVELTYLDLSEGYTKTNPVCGLDNGSIVGDAIGGASPYTYLWDDGSTQRERDLLPDGIYNLTVTDADGCTATRQFDLENDNDITISASGGDEGFHDGKFIEGGVDLNWYFRPMTVADQLIIESSTDGVLLNTGAVTTRSNCGCNSDPKCDCADVFLGDFADQTISLLVGSGLVDPPSTNNCSGSNTPKSANGIGGTITIPSDGYITVTVIGNSCGSGYTNWYVTLTCESIVRNSRNEDKYPIKDDVFNEIEELLGIDLYPNPSTNYINLEIHDRFEEAQYAIFSVEGQQIRRLTTIQESLNAIDLSELTPGLYFMKVVIDGNSYVKKIVKQ